MKTASTRLSPSRFIRALRSALESEFGWHPIAPNGLCRDSLGNWINSEGTSIEFQAGNNSSCRVTVVATFANAEDQDGLTIEIIGGLSSCRWTVAKLVDEVLAERASAMSTTELTARDQLLR